jgi:SAM-dependent methyltransferase
LALEALGRSCSLILGREASQRSDREGKTMGKRTSEDRLRWEGRWRRQRPDEFQFHISEPPEELVALVEPGGLPDGAALDLGCGAGIPTAYLAGFFRPTVGLDIALAATLAARQVAEERGVEPAFVVAEAPILPFREEAFVLVFDRGGCLQHMPRPAWPRYFWEVKRILKPGGMLQLFIHRKAGLRTRAWLRALRRGHRPQVLSHDLLRKMASPSLRELTMRDFSFTTSTGQSRLFTYGLFEKREL